MKFLRILLFPFSVIYGGIIALRNLLYDKGFFSSETYSFPVICIGNLNLGGTGKSPMVEYLLEVLIKKYRVAVLSRGYKRKTKGFKLLSGSETAAEVGDEPLQFKLKYPQAQVAVDENRQHGIQKLREQEVPPEVILLDDAFQHRKVKAGLNILLTTFNALFYKDLILPSGNLREPKRGAKRANIIVVTKCPPDISIEKRNQIRHGLKPESHQSVFFSSISYSEEIRNKKKATIISAIENFTLVTGIANPKPLVEHLKSKNLDFEHLAFPDHHHFTVSELEKIKNKAPVLTTEKDYMRLKDFLPEEHLFFLPIKTQFLPNAEAFENKVLDFIEKS